VWGCGNSPLRVIWPNSGKLLKPMIPSKIWKYFCGWINYSCMVISQRIYESLMDNRGSKSNKGNTLFVKEQRVDGHKCVKFTHLRYTLMDFERNYQVRIPSNQLSIRLYSTSTLNNLHNIQLNPWFLTGFSDGESNFTVRLIPSNSSKTGFNVQPVFQIGLHKKDLNLLKDIKAYFGVGDIYYKEMSCNYIVQSLKDMYVIIDHFNKYPLLTKKRGDYLLFLQIVSLINKKEHLTIEGLQKIFALRASMNLGLSPAIKEKFPGIVPAERSERSDEDILKYKIDPNWIVGFTDAEGCFSVNVTKSSTVKIGYQVQLRYSLTQHSKDKILMGSLVNFWGCGKVFIRHREAKVDFLILKIKDLSDKVLPLFSNFPLQGEKFKDFCDFAKVVKIMENKGHFTEEGLSEIRKLKVGMNRGRE
uniref:homing endonuclease n=1 Tax=Leptographium procerum TaxID=100367 RepID=UPI0023F45F0A